MPLRAGVAYPVRLEYVYPANGHAIPAEVELRIARGYGVEPEPAVSVRAGASPPAAHPARPAAAFYRAVAVGTGVRLNRIDEEQFARLTRRIGELGVAYIRGGFYPWSVEKPIVHERLMALHEATGVGLVGICRERWDTYDPTEVMAGLADAVADAPYLAMLEGPDEPYRHQERFNYRGHGFKHYTAEKIGDGWAEGAVRYTRDMHGTLRGDDRFAHVRVASGSFVHGPWYPDNVIGEHLTATGADLAPYIELGNLHVYHTATPYARVYNHLYKLRALTPNAGWIVTEMGWNSGNNDHDQVDPQTKAKFTLRNHLCYFNAGSQLSATFALHHYQSYNAGGEQGLKSFGLLNQDYSPRPAFHALRRLVELVKDDHATRPVADLDPIAGELAYTLKGGDATLKRTLLRRADGDYLLVLWHEVRGHRRTSDVQLRLERPMNVRLYRPTLRDEPQDHGERDRLTFHVGTGPVVLQIGPAPSE